jgi:translation initiation factor 2 gamma subunit (eIF-2gamma)
MIMSHACSRAADRALTLGVIGHVDHGKTALVRALTGIETDRLREERERGLSIVLGFAFLETPHGVVDLIDVPGHEAFIRAMIAGATALDGIVLCVAANEGVPLSVLMQKALRSYVAGAPQPGDPDIVAKLSGRIPIDRELLRQVMEEEGSVLDSG